MDLIDRNEAINAIKKCCEPFVPMHTNDLYVAVKAIENLPSAQQIVRCEDCRWWNKAECHSTIVPDVRKCMVKNVFTDYDQLCKYGERRE